VPDSKGLTQQAERIGHISQEVAVRGESRGFAEDLVSDVRSLATVCAEYARMPITRSGDDVIEFREQFEPVNDRILESTTPEYREPRVFVVICARRPRCPLPPSDAQSR